MPSRMAKLARKRKALKKKERIAKIALKLKLETLKKQVAEMRQLDKEKKNKKQSEKKDIFAEEDKKKQEEEDGEEEEQGEEGGLYNLKGLTLEEQLAELEKSDQSDIEAIKNYRKTGRVIKDSTWKNLVAMVGTAIVIGLVFITLQLVNALLSGGFSGE